MRSLRCRCSALLAFFALSFAFAALSPTEARAEWIDGTYKTCYFSDTVPTSFKVSIANGKAVDYTYLVYPNYYLPDDGYGGSVYNTAPSGGAYYVRVANIASGTLAQGNRIKLGNLGNVSIDYVTSKPTMSYEYKSRSFNATNYRYFVSKSGNVDLTEIFPNENGVFVMPFTAQYLFVTCYVPLSGMGSYYYWYPTTSLMVSYERPEDQNEVAAINDQTTTLTDTTGSDTVTTDVATPTVQQVEGLQLFQFVTNQEQSVSNQLTTQEVDGSITFPGLSWNGFTVPAAVVTPMEVVPDNLKTPIKLLVTFVFCSAFMSHIIGLLHAIFGIYNYFEYGSEEEPEGRVLTAVRLDGP